MSLSMVSPLAKHPQARQNEDSPTYAFAIGLPKGEVYTKDGIACSQLLWDDELLCRCGSMVGSTLVAMTASDASMDWFSRWVYSNMPVIVRKYERTTFEDTLRSAYISYNSTDLWSVKAYREHPRLWEYDYTDLKHYQISEIDSYKRYCEENANPNGPAMVNLRMVDFDDMIQKMPPSNVRIHHGIGYSRNLGTPVLPEGNTWLRKIPATPNICMAIDLRADINRDMDITDALTLVIRAVGTTIFGSLNDVSTSRYLQAWKKDGCPVRLVDLGDDFDYVVSGSNYRSGEVEPMMFTKFVC